MTKPNTTEKGWTQQHIEHVRFMVQSLTTSSQWINHPANGDPISDVERCVSIELLREWKEHLDMILNNNKPISQ